jgi:hypothetical protein
MLSKRNSNVKKTENYKKIVKKSSNLFDIDNFVIHSNNSSKFLENEKKINVNIPVPKYTMLNSKFFKLQTKQSNDVKFSINKGGYK